MDGSTVQNYFSLEVKTILDAYRKFETLIPSPKGKGSQHNQEDGRFIEGLLRDTLKRLLPQNLDVTSGFIVRPAAKTDKDNRNRKSQSDRHSTQLDIIIYEKDKYPIFMKFGDTALVPPESVIAIISVKKNLRKKNIIPELTALREAAKLCIDNNMHLRPPYLALVSISHTLPKTKIPDIIWADMEKSYNTHPLAFDEMVGFMGVLDSWSIFKTRPKNNKLARYIYFTHDNENDNQHLGLQFILTGIMSVYYDSSRTGHIKRPGFTSFSMENSPCKGYKDIPYSQPALIFGK